LEGSSIVAGMWTLLRVEHPQFLQELFFWRISSIELGSCPAPWIGLPGGRRKRVFLRHGARPFWRLLTVVDRHRCGLSASFESATRCSQAPRNLRSAAVWPVRNPHFGYSLVFTRSSRCRRDWASVSLLITAAYGTNDERMSCAKRSCCHCLSAETNA